MADQKPGDIINSPVMGESMVPDKIQEDEIENYVRRSPVAVFQHLNKFLSERGFIIMIDVHPESRIEPEGEWR